MKPSAGKRSGARCRGEVGARVQSSWCRRDGADGLGHLLAQPWIDCVCRPLQHVACFERWQERGLTCVCDRADRERLARGARGPAHEAPAVVDPQPRAAALLAEQAVQRQGLRGPRQRVLGFLVEQALRGVRLRDEAGLRLLALARQAGRAVEPHQAERGLSALSGWRRLTCTSPSWSLSTSAPANVSSGLIGPASSDQSAATRSSTRGTKPPSVNTKCCVCAAAARGSGGGRSVGEGGSAPRRWPLRAAGRRCCRRRLAALGVTHEVHAAQPSSGPRARSRAASRWQLLATVWRKAGCARWLRSRRAARPPAARGPRRRW